MGNKKVLACQIDEELKAKMEEQRKNKKLSVKDYIIGLIEQDLKTYSFEVTSKEYLDKLQQEISKKEEIKIQETDNKQEETIKDQKQNERSKKDEIKKQANVMDKKVEQNKSKIKKIEKV